MDRLLDRINIKRVEENEIEKIYYTNLTNAQTKRQHNIILTY